MLLIFMCCKVQLWRAKDLLQKQLSKAVAVDWEVDRLTVSDYLPVDRGHSLPFAVCRV